MSGLYLYDLPDFDMRRHLDVVDVLKRWRNRAIVWSRKTPENFGWRYATIPLLAATVILLVQAGAYGRKDLALFGLGTALVAVGLVIGLDIHDRAHPIPRRPISPLDWVSVRTMTECRTLATRLGRIRDPEKAWGRFSATMMDRMPYLPSHVLSAMLDAFHDEQDRWAVVSLGSTRPLRPGVVGALLYQKGTGGMIVGVWRDGRSWPIEPMPLTDFGIDAVPRPVRYLTTDQARMVRATLEGKRRT